MTPYPKRLIEVDLPLKKKAYGNRAEVSWLLRYYGRFQVVAWLRRLGERRLPWRRYNLWCILFKLSPARRLRPEGGRIWPY